MSIFSKLTLCSLIKNKVRTIVTIIGIMLSATMICSVTTFASSLANYGKECVIYTDGNWHLKQLNSDYKFCKDLADYDEVKESTILQHIGYTNLYRSEDVQKDPPLPSKPYVYVAGTQANAPDFLPVHITSGKYPTSPSEILLPSHLYTNGKLKYEIGDTLTLELGERILNGVSLQQDTPYIDEQMKFSGETFVFKESRTYTVVGFYEYESHSFESSGAPGFTALTIADSTPSDNYMYDVYLQMNDPASTYRFVNKNQLPVEINSDLLMFYGAFSLNSIATVFYGLAIIVIALIMIASIALIYNSFSITVSERTKLFGLLSSIGATKSQLRKMVLFESLVVSAIGIPLGVIAGIGGIGVTLLNIESKFHTMVGLPIDFELSFSFTSVIVTIVISLLTVLISAWIPSKRATKASAVEAIRQSNDIPVKSKKLKTSKIIYKIFGIPGVIADKHYKRNIKKYRTTVFSLFISIVLFISASAFTDYLTNTVDEASSITNYGIHALIDSNEFKDITPEQLAEQIQALDNITNVLCTKYSYINFKINENHLSQEGIDKIKFNNYGENPPPNDEYEIQPQLYFVDDNIFKSLLRQHNLNEEDFMNPENPQAIAIDGISTIDPLTNKTEKIHYFKDGTAEGVGILEQTSPEGYRRTFNNIEKDGITFIEYETFDGSEKIEIPKDEVYVIEPIKIGYVTNELPSFIISNDSLYSLALIYPNSVSDNMFEKAPHNFYYCIYQIKSKNHNNSFSEIQNVFDDNNIRTIMSENIAEKDEVNKSTLIVIKIFATGFIILISLISMANVFNTISTSIALRRKEFAILRSIGMTKKELNKMMRFECLLYGFRALLYGLPVSILISFLIHLTFNNGINIAFHLPWIAIGIAVLSVFLVVFITMIYAMSKIKKDNLINVLKSENF